MVTTTLSVIIVPGKAGSFSAKGAADPIEIAGSIITSTNSFNQSLLQPLSIFGSIHTNTSSLNQGIMYFGVKLTTSRREVPGSTENPSVYTLNESRDWIAVTIGIKGIES